MEQTEGDTSAKLLKLQRLLNSMVEKELQKSQTPRQKQSDPLISSTNSGQSTWGTHSIDAQRDYPDEPWRKSRNIEVVEDDALNKQISTLQSQVDSLGEQLSSVYTRLPQKLPSPKQYAPPSGTMSSHYSLTSLQTPIPLTMPATPVVSFQAPPPSTSAPHPARYESFATQTPALARSTGSFATRSALESVPFPRATFHPAETISDSPGSQTDASVIQLQQVLVDERMSRQTALKEIDRLRAWVQDLRAERQKLEDALVGSSSSTKRALLLRNELESAVSRLAASKEALEAELGGLKGERAAGAAALAEAESLRAALEIYAGARSMFEGQLAELSRGVSELATRHSQRTASLKNERDTMVVKWRRETSTTASLREEMAQKEQALRDTEQQVRSKDEQCRELKAANEQLQATNSTLSAQVERLTKEAAEQSQRSASDADNLRADILREVGTLQSALSDASASMENVRSERDNCMVALDAAHTRCRELAQELELTRARAQMSDRCLEEVEARYAAQSAAAASNAELAASRVALSRNEALAANDALRAQLDVAKANTLRAQEEAAALRQALRDTESSTSATKMEMEALRVERDELQARLAVLRREHDQQMMDGRGRLALAQQQQELELLKAQYEARLTEALSSIDKLKEELLHSSKECEMTNAKMSQLREEIRDLMSQRDALEHELEGERAFNEDLNHIINQLKKA